MKRILGILMIAVLLISTISISAVSVSAKSVVPIQSVSFSSTKGFKDGITVTSLFFKNKSLLSLSRI